jgi:hypothetical protein
MRFGLFGSARAKRGGPDVDSGAGFREFVEPGEVVLDEERAAEAERHRRAHDIAVLGLFAIPLIRGIRSIKRGDAS